MKHTALPFIAAALLIAACGTAPKHPKTHAARTQTARTPAPKTIRISHIGRTAGGQELMLHSLDLVGTPYR